MALACCVLRISPERHISAGRLIRSELVERFIRRPPGALAFFHTPRLFCYIRGLEQKGTNECNHLILDSRSLFFHHMHGNRGYAMALSYKRTLELR